MEKNKIVRCGERLIRILELKSDSVLIVDCLHQSMPKWMHQSILENHIECTEEELASITGRHITDYDSLSKENRRISHERFTMIAGILSLIGDEQQRCSMINLVAEEKGISKQTIRKYLWLYLTYQEISVLAPKERKQNRPLTEDEKNMRWALNKFFYTRHKNSLNTTYTLLLKAKYCDQSGTLLPSYPSINQFKYFYRKHRKLQTYYISREGLKAYQRNHRPLLGDGIQEFAPNVGVGMLDSTVCDIYIVDDAGNLVGRPILTACVDAYSGLCCGYALTWEGGVYSLRSLMLNVIANKEEWCNQFGIRIKSEDWNCSQIPATLVTDMGSEYKSDTFGQIAELGVTIINLQSFRPDMKGRIEKFFDIVQSNYKKYLKGRGVIQPDFQERGAKDYRREACLTMREFEKIVVHCIVYYNSQRILEKFPFTKEMLDIGILPYASDIWNWGRQQRGANLIAVNKEELILTLLPRTRGEFRRNGLRVNGLRYRNEEYTEAYLKGESVTVAYNPDNVSTVWLIEGGRYKGFTLAESRYFDLNQKEVEFLASQIKSQNKALNVKYRQAEIDLATHIEAIVNASTSSSATNIKHIRDTRKKEQDKAHKDFVRGTVENG